eukprot:NODE_6302_length_550_cov_41.687943_g6137_i0.p1 GENE.NODE_6302_length_550_cov_41.687943_g6137_i0~~NODE_6302_length_550_cov_41.687943_g6137_i0.p1  ORF type:complete len:142 (-),score=30.08 NODE_6302_length_550_cov_41.687943_g6137_i0:67-492(-)
MPKVEGSMGGGIEDESSSEEEDGTLEVATLESTTTAQPSEPSAASSASPARLLEDSEEDEEDKTTPSQVANALAEISLKPKAGRSAQGLLFAHDKKKNVAPIAPSYGDEEWGNNTNAPTSEDVALTKFSKVKKEKKDKAAN